MERYCLGITMPSLGTNNLVKAFEEARRLGIQSLQLGSPSQFTGSAPGYSLGDACSDISPSMVSSALPNIHSMSVCYAGIYAWLADLEKAAVVCGNTGISLLSGHLTSKGMPYNTNKISAALQRACKEMDNAHPLRFAVETGTEAPDLLYGFISQLPKMGVSFDAANFLIYQTATANNAVGAVSLFGNRIAQAHIKDAVPGSEVELGKGDVGIERYVNALLQAEYKGPFILETGGKFDTRYERSCRALEVLRPILDRV